MVLVISLQLWLILLLLRIRSSIRSEEISQILRNLFEIRPWQQFAGRSHQIPCFSFLRDIIKLTECTDLEMMKLWKGLFYTFWMSDKPPIQEELANVLSAMVAVWSLVECSFLNSAQKSFLGNISLVSGRPWFVNGEESMSSEWTSISISFVDL